MSSGLFKSLQSIAVIMDMQPRLINSVLDGGDLIESVTLFAKGAGLLGLPIVITEQVPEKLGSTMTKILNEVDDQRLVRKNSFSAFGSREFVDYLNEFSIDHLFLVGVETPICIYLTALDALKNDLEVSIITDCIGERRKSDGLHCLEALRTHGCSLIPLETFFYSMLKDSTHPEFKSVSALIRNRNLP